MEVPTTLPGTDIAGYLARPFDDKRIEKASPRAISEGYWRITDTRPGIMEQAALAGYVYYHEHWGRSGKMERRYWMVWPGGIHRNRISQVPDPVTVSDERHTRNYASAAIAAYMEAEIAKELAKHERETSSRKRQQHVKTEADYQRRCIEQGQPPISATCYDMLAEGISKGSWAWHAHRGGDDACAFNTASFVDVKGHLFPMREYDLCKGYRTAEDAVHEARRRARNTAVKHVA